MGTDRDGKKASQLITDTANYANDIIIQTASFIDNNKFGFGAGLAYVGGVLTTGSAGLCASSVSITTGCVGVTIAGGPIMAVCVPTGIVAGGSCAVSGAGVAMMAKGTQMMAESNGGGSKGKNSNTSNQDKKLGDKEISKLKKGGIDVHDYKPGSEFDLYKNKNGDIYYKRQPKYGTSDPEFIDLNINNF